MSWSYRIVKTVDEPGDEELYAVHAVYAAYEGYHSDTGVLGVDEEHGWSKGWSTRPAEVSYCLSVDEIVDSLVAMLEACRLPVLEERMMGDELELCEVRNYEDSE